MGQSINRKLTRRNFVKLTGAATVYLMTGGLLTGCATNPYKLDPEEFTIKNFDNWFKQTLLYTGLNPNLVGSHNRGWNRADTFKKASWNGYTPGPCYRTTVMVATAPGVVKRRNRLKKRKRGLHVAVEHYPYVGKSELHKRGWVLRPKFSDSTTLN